MPDCITCTNETTIKQKPMNEILSQVLGHIRLVADDKEKLQKILNFIVAEIYEEPEEETLEIPERFEKLLNPIAQSIDCGQVVYINLDTMETEEVVPDMEDPEDFELNYGDCDWATEPAFYKWENTIRFEPLEPHESFKIMEAFAENMGNEKFREQLFHALNHRKPFANFKWKIDNSNYRQNWFDFKQQRLENHVREVIWSELNKISPDD